jgi:hypothetical protein
MNQNLMGGDCSASPRALALARGLLSARLTVHALLEMPCWLRLAGKLGGDRMVLERPAGRLVPRGDGKGSPPRCWQSCPVWLVRLGFLAC